jgi:hypothetical protein
MPYADVDAEADVGEAGSLAVLAGAAGKRQLERQKQMSPHVYVWYPGLLPRALVIGLGYFVGSGWIYSDTGTQTMGIVVISILINESVTALLKLSRLGVDKYESEYAEKIYRSYHRWSVLWRYFSITALTYAVNETTKRLFGSLNTLVVVFVMMIMIYVLSEVTDALTDSPLPGTVKM